MANTTLILGFVTLLVGIMLVGASADLVWDATGKTSTTINETVYLNTTRNNPGFEAGWVNQTITFTLTQRGGVTCSNLGMVLVTNSSGSALIANTDFVTATTDSGYTIYFMNTTRTNSNSTVGALYFKGATGNTTLVSYSYTPADYICDGFSRTALNLVPGFFGLALLAASVGIFFKVAKEEGIADI